MGRDEAHLTAGRQKWVSGLVFLEFCRVSAWGCAWLVWMCWCRSCVVRVRKHPRWFTPIMEAPLWTSGPILLTQTGGVPVPLRLTRFWCPLPPAGDSGCVPPNKRCLTQGRQEAAGSSSERTARTHCPRQPAPREAGWQSNCGRVTPGSPRAVAPEPVPCQWASAGYSSPAWANGSKINYPLAGCTSISAEGCSGKDKSTGIIYPGITQQITLYLQGHQLPCYHVTRSPLTMRPPAQGSPR